MGIFPVFWKCAYCTVFWGFDFPANCCVHGNLQQNHPNSPLVLFLCIHYLYVLFCIFVFFEFANSVYWCLSVNTAGACDLTLGVRGGSRPLR